METDKIEWFTQKAITYGINIGVAILILAIGFWLGNKLKNIIRNRMIKRRIDPSIREFILPILGIVLKILVILTAVNTVGIQITSFAAILAGLAAGIGLSLQGSLSNFAGGLLIILFKPFKVGDYIEALNQAGTVETISILYTTLLTEEHEVVLLPNSILLNNPIVNHSMKDTRRLTVNVGISYNDDVEKAREILKKIFETEPLISNKHTIEVEILEFADNSINLGANGYVKEDDYWKAYYKLYQETQKIFEENGISIPFPENAMKIVSSNK